MHSITDTDDLRTAYRNATETDAPDRADAVTVAYAPALAATLAATVNMTNPDPDAPGLDTFAEYIEGHDDLADGVDALADVAAALATPEGEDRTVPEVAEQVARDVVAEVEANAEGDGDAPDVADVDLTTFEAAATAELSTAPGNSTGGARPSSDATTALNANSDDGSDGPESAGTLADHRERSGDTDAAALGDPAAAERQGRKYARAEREIQQSLAEQTRTRTNSDGDEQAERSAGTLADHRERQGRGDHTPATGSAGRDNESGPGKLDGDRWDPGGGDDGDDTAPTGTLANYRNSRGDRDDRPLRGVSVANGKIYAGTNADTRTTERPPDRLSRHGRVVEAGSREYVLRARQLRRDGKFPWPIPGEDDHEFVD